MNGFVCTKCGECCTNLGKDQVVMLFPEDLEKVPLGLKMSRARFLEEYTYVHTDLSDDVIEVRCLKYTDGRCQFLTEDNLCSIHTSKPIQCRLGPDRFLFGGMATYPCYEPDMFDPGYSTEESDKAFFQQFLEVHRKDL